MTTKHRIDDGSNLFILAQLSGELKELTERLESTDSVDSEKREKLLSHNRKLIDLCESVLQDT